MSMRGVGQGVKAGSGKSDFITYAARLALASSLSAETPAPILLCLLYFYCIYLGKLFILWPNVVLNVVGKAKQKNRAHELYVTSIESAFSF